MVARLSAPARGCPSPAPAQLHGRAWCARLRAAWCACGAPSSPDGGGRCSRCRGCAVGVCRRLLQRWLEDRAAAATTPDMAWLMSVGAGVERFSVLRCLVAADASDFDRGCGSRAARRCRLAPMPPPFVSAASSLNRWPCRRSLGRFTKQTDKRQIAQREQLLMEPCHDGRYGLTIAQPTTNAAMAASSRETPRLAPPDSRADAVKVAFT